MADPEKKESSAGIAPELIGRYDSTWQPGDQDPNTALVYLESEPGKPGIKPQEEAVDIGGVLLNPQQLARLNKLRASKRLGFD
jgi:hypothetical protein